jgi:membrane-associated phospholipid phosphatase
MAVHQRGYRLTMGDLRVYLASLENGPWQRGAWQGIVIGVGVAIAGVIAGRSWVFVVVSAAGVGLAIAVLFGFLLRAQTARRSPKPSERRP